MGGELGGVAGVRRELLVANLLSVNISIQKLEHEALWEFVDAPITMGSEKCAAGRGGRTGCGRELDCCQLACTAKPGNAYYWKALAPSNTVHA